MSSKYAANLTNHNPTVYSTNASFVYSAKYTNAVLSLLDAQPGEKIIDLGCGTGEITRQLKDAVGKEGVVVGVDSSEAMLVKARDSSQGFDIDYKQCDIQQLSKDGSVLQKWHHSFDKVFTSATLHWCKADPAGVVESVKWLLKPGGVFAYEFGGYNNAVGVRSAMHRVMRDHGIDPIPRDPFYYPTAQQYEKLLQEGAMSPLETGLFPRPTPLPTGMRGWLDTFTRNTFLAGIEKSIADKILDQVEEECRVDMYWSMDSPGMAAQKAGDGVEDGWEIMYVRLRGRATWEGNDT